MNDIVKEFQYLDIYLKELMPIERNTASELLQSILEGKWILEPNYFFRLLKEIFLGYGDELKKTFIKLLMLFITSSLLYALTSAFKDTGMGRITRLFFIVCELIVLISAINEVMIIAQDSLDKMIGFLKLSIPAYMICIAATGSSLSATVFYKMLISFICLIEGIVIATITPAIKSYMLLGVVESIFAEERFKGIMEIIKKCITYILKGLVVIVSTSGILQIIITPVIDKAGTGIALKAVSAIPFIGDIVQSISGITIASAVTLKNSMGVIIMLIIVLVLLTPAVKIFLIIATLQLATAIGAITGEKQMVSCATYMADAGMLYLKTILTIGALFFLAIAALTGITGAI